MSSWNPENYGASCYVSDSGGCWVAGWWLWLRSCGGAAPENISTFRN